MRAQRWYIPEQEIEEGQGFQDVVPSQNAGESAEGKSVVGDSKLHNWSFVRLLLTPRAAVAVTIVT